MSNLDKINIYVPEHIGQILERDAEMFEVFKKDGNTINKNRFLSKLLLEYYSSYANERQQAYEKIATCLMESGIDSGRSHDIADGDQV